MRGIFHPVRGYRKHDVWPRKSKLAMALFLIAWTDGYTGERVGEADIPGHDRRGPKGYNLRATANEKQ